MPGSVQGQVARQRAALAGIFVLMEGDGLCRNFAFLQSLLKRYHKQLGVISQRPCLSRDAKDTQKLFTECWKNEF